MTVKQDHTNLLFYFLLILTCLVVYGINKVFGKAIKQWLFASYCTSVLKEYHATMKETKKSHFDSMHEHAVKSPSNQTSGLKILEIGAGSGENFEFFPLNSRLTVVEPNIYSQSLFYENQKKYPHIKMERYLVASAEDMKEVEDNSIDIVVSTLVLCSVTDVEKTLEEVLRVLAPGGKFYFWEHVHDIPGTWLHTVQTLVNPIWKFLFNDCNVNRNIDKIIKTQKEFSKVEHRRFDVPPKGLWRFLRTHVMGVATK